MVFKSYCITFENFLFTFYTKSLTITCSLSLFLSVSFFLFHSLYLFLYAYVRVLIRGIRNVSFQKKFAYVLNYRSLYKLHNIFSLQNVFVVFRTVEGLNILNQKLVKAIKFIRNMYFIKTKYLLKENINTFFYFDPWKLQFKMVARSKKCIFK